MDIVHIGWECCPVALKVIYKGKEGYPTIGFQVISSYGRQILYVSSGYPRTRNDNQIMKVDDFPSNLHAGNHWLSNRFWFCQKYDGTVLRFRGLYLIAYHRFF